MESFNFTSPQDTFELVAESFEVSGGSNQAHALYIRGIALHLGMESHQVSQILKNRAASLDKNEFHTLMKRMAQGHKANQLATSRTSETIAFFTGEPKQNAISELIPDDQHAFHRLLQLNDGKYQQSQIDKALKKIWESPARESINNDMKALSAELGAYNDTNWWEKTDSTKKQTLTEHGKEILNS